MYRHPFLSGATAPPALREIGLTELPLIGKGKVREIYDLGDQLLIVSTDRVSAFDVVMQEPIPGKGDRADVAVGVLVRAVPRHRPQPLAHRRSGRACRRVAHRRDQLAGRAMLVRKCQRIDIECVVRGYLAGPAGPSTADGTLAGEPLPRHAGSRASCPSRASRRAPRPSPRATTSNITRARWRTASGTS